MSTPWIPGSHRRHAPQHAADRGISRVKPQQLAPLKVKENCPYFGVKLQLNRREDKLQNKQKKTSLILCSAILLEAQIKIGKIFPGPKHSHSYFCIINLLCSSRCMGMSVRESNSKTLALLIFCNIYKKKKGKHLNSQYPLNELTFPFPESLTRVSPKTEIQQGESVLDIFCIPLHLWRPRLFKVQNVLTDFSCSNPFTSLLRTFPDQLES